MLGSAREDPRLGDVAGLVVGVGGLAACITLMFNAMRAVMDVGGACAEGGPYVPAQSCPEGSTVALLLGVFGLFAFAGLGAWFGVRVGAPWGGVPVLAWSGLFGALGWNFLDYGLVNPPDGGIEWGWLIPGVMFEAMALGPLLLGLWAIRSNGPVARATAAIAARPLPGPRQRDRSPAASPSFAAAEAREADAREREALRGIASAMGAAVAGAEASTPVDPRRRAEGSDDAAGAAAAFSEGTQALLDRLERLADMRDRGLLRPDEYETAKEAVMRELEARA